MLGQRCNVNLTGIFGFAIWAMLGQRCKLTWPELILRFEQCWVRGVMLTLLDSVLRFEQCLVTWHSIEKNWQVRVISARDILKFYCQKYSVNMIEYICKHFAGKINIVCDPTVPWKGIDKGFYWEKVGWDLLRFLTNPQLSTNLVCLYQLLFELGSHAIPLSMMSCREFFVNTFLYPWPLEALDCYVTVSTRCIFWVFTPQMISRILLGIKEVNMNFVEILSRD